MKVLKKKSKMNVAPIKPHAKSDNFKRNKNEGSHLFVDDTTCGLIIRSICF